MKKKEEEKKPRRRVKRVKHHGGGHHGGAWKVAYADFVTAMMALFLVLWLVSQADMKLKQSIASYFRSPGVFNTIQGGILSGAKKVSKEPDGGTSKDEEQALFNVAQNLQKKFETRPEFSKYKDQIKVDVTDQGLKIQILDKADQVSFPVGSAEMSADSRAVLAEIAHAVCALPNPIFIGGHTDARVFPSTTGYTNWELSADRANAARRVLQSECVRPEQIRRIIGYADSDLLIPEDPFAHANRRISITVSRTRLEFLENGEVGDPNADDQNQPAAPPAAPDKKGKPEKANPQTAAASPDAKKSAEAEAARRKLAAEGAVTVGEPDTVPEAPKSVEPPKAKP